MTAKEAVELETKDRATLPDDKRLGVEAWLSHAKAQGFSSVAAMYAAWPDEMKAVDGSPEVKPAEKPKPEKPKAKSADKTAAKASKKGKK